MASVTKSQEILIRGDIGRDHQTVSIKGAEYILLTIQDSVGKKTGVWANIALSKANADELIQFLQSAFSDRRIGERERRKS